MCLASNQEPVSVSSWVTGASLIVSCYTHTWGVRVCLQDVCVRPMLLLSAPPRLPQRALCQLKCMHVCVRAWWHIIYGNRQRFQYAALIYLTHCKLPQRIPPISPRRRLYLRSFLVRRPEKLFPRVRRWWVLKVCLMLGELTGKGLVGETVFLSLLIEGGWKK